MMEDFKNTCNLNVGNNDPVTLKGPIQDSNFLEQFPVYGLLVLFYYNSTIFFSISYLLNN